MIGHHHHQLLVVEHQIRTQDGSVVVHHYLQYMENEPDYPVYIGQARDSTTCHEDCTWGA